MRILNHDIDIDVEHVLWLDLELALDDGEVVYL